MSSQGSVLCFIIVFCYSAGVGCVGGCDGMGEWMGEWGRGHPAFFLFFEGRELCAYIK